MSTILPLYGEVKLKGSPVANTFKANQDDIKVTTPPTVTARPIQRPSEVILYSPTPPTLGIITQPNIYSTFWQIYVLDKNGNVVDIPQADIIACQFKDVVNGGSGQGTITFRRTPDNIGQIAFQYRVLIWFWPWYIERPQNPYWSGYMVDIDITRLKTDGEVQVTLEGDSRLLAAGNVDEDIYPGAGAGPSGTNPNLDASAYVQHLFSTYSPPGWGSLVIPPTLFALEPLSLRNVGLDAAIDTVLKSGRDSTGSFVTWRTSTNGVSKFRTLTVVTDNNPNVFPQYKFRVILRDSMTTAYKVSTKYRDIVNSVYIEGGKDNATGQTVTAYVQDATSVAEFGPIQASISVPALRSQAALTQYGTTYLALHGYPQAQGTMDITDPDPTIVGGTWVQFVEAVGIVKQVRIAQVTVNIKRTKVSQTLETTAPTPFLDEAVYRMGQSASKAANALVGGLPVNTQNTFVRSGATPTLGP